MTIRRFEVHLEGSGGWGKGLLMYQIHMVSLKILTLTCTAKKSNLLCKKNPHKYTISDNFLSPDLRPGLIKG